MAVLLGAQLLFWSIYALALWELRPTEGLDEYQLPAASTGRIALPEPVGAYAPGLSGPALLRLPGWQAAVLYPAGASLLSRSEQNGSDGAWSLTCLDGPCGATSVVYAAPFERVVRAARLERFQRQDMVWVVTAMGVVMGAALLVLLPISRFSRVHLIMGVFLILVGADAWLTAFGAAAFPQAWFPILRYGVQYPMLTGLALVANAFAGWRTREALAAFASCCLIMLVVVGAVLSGTDVENVAPLLDAAVLMLVLGFGGVALLRLVRTAPGPAIRILSLLLVAITSTAWDLLLYRPPNGPPLQASVLSPPLLIFAVLFEIALQGRRLNQEADESYSELERQALEQDAILLRSSKLLRYQERQIAIDAERQRFLRDMHDGVGGMLTHLMLGLRERALSHGEIEQELQLALDDLRNIASVIDASPGPIDEALTIFHERMAIRLSRCDIAFEWRCRLPIPAPDLDASRLLNLYRLLQEGIANVLRHADASRIELTAEMTGGGTHIVITLADDGMGFDPSRAKGVRGEGYGLMNMRRRAGQMGGRLRIVSAPEQGARLVLTIPVQFAPNPR
jgi:signal transduction histidine kinase